MKQIALQKVTLGAATSRYRGLPLQPGSLGATGASDEDTAIAAIRHAADSGVNFFGTAQGYGFGVSEHLLAQALAG